MDGRNEVKRKEGKNKRKRETNSCWKEEREREVGPRGRKGMGENRRKTKEGMRLDETVYGKRGNEDKGRGEKGE